MNDTDSRLRTSAYYRSVWETIVTGGDTVISVRVIDAYVREMLGAFAEAENRAAAKEESHG